MKKFVLAMLLLAAGPVLAQSAKPPIVGSEPETVYSDAQRAADETLSRRFIQSLLSSPLSLDGQFAKWTGEICPHVFGLSAPSAYLIERRIREVAEQVGAPQDRKDPCVTNISIIVTETPQEKLDSLMAIEPLLFYGMPRGSLKVTRPVTVFYTTFQRDFNGTEHLDVPWEDLGLPGPPHIAANFSHIKTGIQPVMAGAIIIVDAKAVMGKTLGTLGDYFSLLVLAQAPHTGRCQPAPSIANLMAEGCDGELRTTGLSDVDMAMLAGLYATPLEPELLQRARVIGNMRKALEADFTASRR
jgi:hypothetical protein